MQMGTKNCALFSCTGVQLVEQLPTNALWVYDLLL